MRLEKKALVEVLQNQNSELYVLRADHDSLKRMVEDTVLEWLMEKKRKFKKDTLPEYDCNILGLHLSSWSLSLDIAHQKPAKFPP